jgi:outer membrane receptor for ferric coprogen and ferric-rhodotorulic acid
VLRNDYGIATTVGNVLDSLSWFIIPLQRNLLLNARVEQFIHPLKLKYILDANGMLSHQPQQLNGMVFGSTMNSHGFEQRVVSNWKGWFNGELHYSLQQNSFGTSGQQPSTMKRIAYGISTTLRFSTHLFAHVQYRVQHFERGQGFDMLDGMVKAVLSPRWRCSVTLNNLINHHYFELLNASPYGHDRFTQQLNGRQVLFGLNWGF